MNEDNYLLSAAQKRRLDLLLNHVLSDIKPSKAEIGELKFVINEIMGRLKNKAPNYVEILLAGSVARDTNIKGKADVDIFLLFPKSMKDTLIERKGLEIGKSIVERKNGESFLIKYAEHPYVRLLLNNIGINFDIVPAYKIRDASERGTAVDRTQLHNEFVNSNLNQRQRDDVRLLKAFLKAHSIYGAEAKVEGFSGYLCELLIYHYGSFVNLIKSMANARLPIVINTGKSGQTNNESTEFMLKIFGKRFIVVDPTDSNRNVAANVSDESLFRFVLISRMLISNPVKGVFYGKGKSDTNSGRELNRIREMLGTDIYMLHFKVPEIANEIIWQQLKKTRLRLDDLLKQNGFEPIVSLQNVEGRDAVIGLFINDIKIKSARIIGPSIEMGDAVDRFIMAHKNSLFISVEKDRVYSIEQAKYHSAEELARSFLRDKSTRLPSYLKTKNSSLYINKIPERYAKMLYWAYQDKFSI
jgi:tRNA nucleotidyltransferase (CCA-adding enzyme)